MLESLRRRVLALLRVPPEPRVPEGTPASVMVFRAGRNFYRWQVVVWAMSRAGAVAGLITAYVYTSRFVARAPGWVQSLFVMGEILGAAGLAFGLLVTFLALRWEYELRWYIVTDRSLRIRSGVWNVEELTMTFANVQEIRVSSGPLQTLLGLADVEVLSAGGGAGGSEEEHQSHMASFKGVDNADEIRDLIVERLRVYRDLGLGDRGEAPPRGELAAARAVLEQVRALRGVLAPRV